MAAEKEEGTLEFLITVAIYSFLTWLWFVANDKDDLILIGHTDLVNGWILTYASKTKLFMDLIYFSVSTAVMIIITEIVIKEISKEFPLFKYREDSSFGCAGIVNIIVVLYEFHILEFRIKLIGLLIALIVFFMIGVAIAIKLLEVLRPILKAVDIADSAVDAANSANEVLNSDSNSDTNKNDEKK